MARTRLQEGEIREISAGCGDAEYPWEVGGGVPDEPVSGEKSLPMVNKVLFAVETFHQI
jgi:hypothetical protein